VSEQKKTYGQILKSSALIGGSQVVNLGVGILRNKAMALLVGAVGSGLTGLYSSIFDITRTAAGMGISSSGVREIAEAVSTGDQQRIARTVMTLRRVTLFFGLAGALLLLAFSKPVSWLTFGDYEHTGAVALLSVGVLCSAITAGQTALIQGMRRIRDLAQMSVVAAVVVTVCSVPVVYFYRLDGVAAYVACGAVAGVAISWWYARKIKVEPVQMTWREVAREGAGLMKLGLIFMSSGLMTMGATFMVQLIIKRNMDTAAVGYYRAAWTLGGLFVATVLQSMGADFYPRLTAVANDHKQCNRMVNEQIEIGFLLATPGIMAMMAFARIIIEVFNKADFWPAAEVLRWICLGMLLRVVSWPMGFVLLAKGARRIFFWSELAGCVLQIVLVWVGIRLKGLNGAGMAFFGLYLVYSVGIYIVVRRMTGFRLSAMNVRLAFLFTPLIALVFVAWYLLPVAGMVVLGTIAAGASGIYSLRTLCALIPLQRFPRMAQNLLLFLRLAPSGTDAPAGIEL
jgi:enterobacterial common antigen flippase